jgi:hypothetical protein
MSRQTVVMRRMARSSRPGTAISLMQAFPRFGRRS